MNTPTAIFAGLALIAAAVFFGNGAPARSSVRSGKLWPLEFQSDKAGRCTVEAELLDWRVPILHDKGMHQAASALSIELHDRCLAASRYLFVGTG